MGKFIEEFYYGNLDPQVMSTKENKAVQKQMEVLMLNEDFLTENLSGESKKKLLLETLICTPKVRHFWRCIFLWVKRDKKAKHTRQNSKYVL